MADYYSILKKALSGLPTNTAENRGVVYAKARQAIDRQLRALDPAPAEEAIARQMKLLEQAIANVEGEFTAAPASAVEPESPPPAAPQQPAPRQPAPQQPAPQQPAPQRPAPQRPAPPRPQAAPQPAQRPASAPSGAPSGAVHPARPATRPQAAPTPAVGARPQAPGGAAGQPAYDSNLDALDEFDRGPRPAKRARVSALGREQRRPSRIVPVFVTVFILALLAASGYALWRNKEPLMAALGLDSSMFGGETGSGSQASTGEKTNVPAAGSKDDVRLSPSGETVPGAPSEETQQPPAAQNGAVREAGQPPVQPATPPAANTPATTPQTEQPVQVNPVGTNNEAAQGQSGQENAAAGQPSSLPPPAIAQKAYLYEEGGAGAGATRDNAAIVWSLAHEPPADGMPPEAVIKGEFDVPGRGLTMQLTIKRNVDAALPASHIIELRFHAPSDFSGGEIDNVARFVMKSSEQARGEGLIAVPAKIDTGYFLIALNNLAQAQQTNRKLLLDSSWIDIPVGYTSGRRALVTLEKGAIGDKVFKDAFADWDKLSRASQ